MQSDFALIYVTASSAEEAEKLAKVVLERRLAACANILPATQAFYWWEGQITSASEAVLLLKAPASYYEAIEKLIRAHHSYKVPAILCLPLVQGLPEFFQWIARETEFDY